jgi:hypothetical protein
MLEALRPMLTYLAAHTQDWNPQMEEQFKKSFKDQIDNYETGIKGLKKWNIENGFGMDDGAPPFWPLMNEWVKPSSRTPSLWETYRFPYPWISPDPQNKVYPSRELCEQAYNQRISLANKPASIESSPQESNDGAAGGNDQGTESTTQEPRQEQSKDGDSCLAPAPGQKAGSSGKKTTTKSRARKRTNAASTAGQPASKSESSALVIHRPKAPRYTDNGKVLVSFKSRGASTDSIEPGYTIDGDRILACSTYQTKVLIASTGSTVVAHTRHAYVVQRRLDGHLLILDEAVCGGTYVFKRLQDAQHQVASVITKVEDMWQALQCNRYQFQEHGWGVDWVAIRPEMDPLPSSKPHRIVQVWWRKRPDTADGEDGQLGKHTIAVTRGLLDRLVGKKMADAFTAKAIDSGDSEYQFRSEWEAYRFFGNVTPPTLQMSQLSLMGAEDDSDDSSWEPPVTKSKQKHRNHRSHRKHRPSNRHHMRTRHSVTPDASSDDDYFSDGLPVL